MTKILIFFLILTSKIYAQDIEDKKWFYSKNKKIQAVAFIFHGLNGKPSTMDFLVKFLNEQGIHVLRGALTGHFGNMDSEVSRDIWLKDMNEIYLEAKGKSQSLKVPLYFVGYSLGALLFMDLFSNSPEKLIVDRMIFFSPAFRIGSLMRFFSFIFYLPGGFKLPSRNLPEYRSSDYTSFAAYGALWKSYGRINWERIHPPTALIIMDSKDELVSFGDMETLVKKIPGWEIFEVDTSGSRNSRVYHHLTFNEKCYAEGIWQKIEKKMENFLWRSPGTK